MSKMSQLHAELSQQAYELGFESLDQAIESGEYEVVSTGNWAKLVPTKDEQEKAHDDWLKRKEGILLDLETLKNNVNTTLDRAIDFVKKGEI